MRCDVPANEEARLNALRQYHLLDTAPEQGFDDITDLAAHICQTPIAITVLVDQNRLWFKSKVGLEITQIPREKSFCETAIQGVVPLIVEDALVDERFANSALVNKEPNIRFYAGAPLVNPQGFSLGTLCVIDQKPRKIDSATVGALLALARQVMARMELMRVASELAAALEGMKTLRGMLPMCAWCKRIRDDKGYWEQVEAYLEKHMGNVPSHGICPHCYASQMKNI